MRKLLIAIIICVILFLVSIPVIGVPTKYTNSTEWMVCSHHGYLQYIISNDYYGFKIILLREKVEFKHVDGVEVTSYRVIWWIRFEKMRN
jgi:hypothetical protein